MPSSLIGLPPVSVSATTAKSSTIELPAVTVTAQARSTGIPLPSVTVTTAAAPNSGSGGTATTVAPPGQFHLDAGGVWRPFIIAHLGADGVWRNLADGSVVTAGSVTTEVAPVASFTAKQTSGTSPLTVEFIDTTTYPGGTTVTDPPEYGAGVYGTGTYGR